MDQDNQKMARIWFYYRNVRFSLPSSSSQESSGRKWTPKALKHWAVVLDYMSITNPSKINKRVLYEATDKEGILVARDFAHGEDEEEEWKQMSGFGKEDHGMVTINESRAKSYCEEFNQLKQKYVAVQVNCQKFVDSFLANVLIDGAISLPLTVKEAKSWFDSISSTSFNSLNNLGSGALIKNLIMKNIGDGGLNILAKEAIEQISLNGFGSISLLNQSPFREFMTKEGKQLVLSSLGEMTENMLNAGRGAFSWWNLLQIPVELIVGKLMSAKGFTDLEAYAGKKLASSMTAAGVGFMAGGPFGALGSVAMWIAMEVGACLVKCLLAKSFGEQFTNIFGESETLKLIRSIYRYFQMKWEGGMNASIDWMVDYIRANQNRQKQLA